MDRLRVMAVINGLGTGGAERSLAEMLPLLRDRGIDVQVVCSYEREEGVEPQVSSQGSRVTHLESTRFSARLLELRRLIRFEQPDLIHTTIIESDILGRLAATGTGIPVLTSLVNTSYDPARMRDPNLNRMKLEAVRLIDRFTARHLTAGFHALTEAVAEDAVTALGISRAIITVIGRGRDLTRLGRITPERRSAVRQRLGLTDQHEVVLAVGRQEYQKGHLVLVEAAARLREKHPNLRVLLVGREGTETDRIHRRISDLKVEDVVSLLGHRNDVPDLLAAADVFAFPSLFEGLGGSLLEAMTIGLPCVVSDIPVLREVGSDLVAYATPGSVDEWESTIDIELGQMHEAPDENMPDPPSSEVVPDVSIIADRMTSWYYTHSELRHEANG